MRLTLLIIISWLAGWFAYGVSLAIIYGESPFTHDVLIMGFWPLVFGLPFCLFAIVPVLSLLRVWRPGWPNRYASAVLSMLLSVSYIGMLVGSPFEMPESLLMHIYTMASSLLFGLGYPWAVARPGTALGQWAVSFAVFIIAGTGIGVWLKNMQRPVQEITLEITDGFRGYTCLEVNRSGCPELPRVEGKLVLRFPASGYLCTGSGFIQGPWREKFFFVNDSTRKPIPPNLTFLGGGAGSGGFELAPGVVRHYEVMSWFIGTREDQITALDPGNKSRSLSQETCDRKIRRMVHTGG